MLVSKLRGHCAYYGITGNASSLSTCSFHVVHIWQKWLNRRSQKRSMPWKRFLRLLARYPLPRMTAIHSAARSEAIRRGAGCGRTRTSGSVGGWGRQRPWSTRPVRQRISAVMNWAIAMGYRPDNPAGDALGQALGRQQAVVQHMRALPHGEVAAALATVRTSQASVIIKRTFEFLVLTAARSGEVRLATWDEMDLDTGVWAIPAARMKAKRDHRVPLSSRALAILHDVQRRSDGTGLVFRSLRGKPLSTVTLPRLTKELGIAAVPHGFRSSFRDWAAERTNTPREVVEAALAHTVQNPTEAAYARSDLFERRRRLMDDWAEYLTAQSS